jgi:hypothetical protein
VHDLSRGSFIKGTQNSNWKHQKKDGPTSMSRRAGTSRFSLDKARTKGILIV